MIIIMIIILTIMLVIRGIHSDTLVNMNDGRLEVVHPLGARAG